ncbi:MAG: class I SAM-dependent methyltransferase, partial [Thermoleophilaceae bacterium]
MRRIVSARIRWARRLETIVQRGALASRGALPMRPAAAVVALTRRVGGSRDESRAYLWLAGLRRAFPDVRSQAHEASFQTAAYFDALEDAAYGEYLASNVELIRHVTPDRHASVCDLGCGRGQLLGLMAEHGYENLTGLEISEAAVDRRVHESVRLSPGLGSIPDNSFDTVCLISVLEHVGPGDVPGFVRDVGRIASRAVVCCTPSYPANLLSFFERDMTHRTLR